MSREGMVSRDKPTSDSQCESFIFDFGGRGNSKMAVTV